MKTSLLLPLLLCLLVGSTSASFNLPYIPSQLVEVWSDYYFVSQLGFSDGGDVSVTITADPNTMDISNSVLEFGNTTRENSFRIRAQAAAYYTITFTMSDGDYDVITVSAANRTISIEGLASATIVQGVATEPLQVRLNCPSTDDLVITPTSDTGSVVFTPAQITIPEGAIAAPFTLTANVLEPSVITYQVTGYESKYYGPVTKSQINSIYPRDIVVGGLSSLAQVGRNSTSFYVYTPVATSSSITVTPTAVDTQFFPPSANFDSTDRIKTFTFVSSTPANGYRNVYFDVSGPGADDYEASEAATTGLTKKSITIHPPSYYVVNKKTKLSIRIGAPVAKDVSISLFAGNLAFTPSTVQFTGDMTSAQVEVWPKALGNDVISFSVDGSDQDWYATPGSISLIVGGGSFISPTSWYVPWLWLGVESPKIPVRASVAPDSEVVLIPQAPDLVFSPSQLKFSPQQMEQSFTITPASTNTGADASTVTNVQISFIVDGTDYQMFSPPASVSVTVQRRTLQFAWSAHLTQNSAVGVLDLYLNKQYEFWATVSNAPSDELSVIPTSPYITFDPSELKFTPDVLSIKVIATINAAVGATNIDWVMGGKSGGMYTQPAPQTVNTQLRPLDIYQYMIAPDDRVYPGQILTGQNWGTSYLGGNHVYWFSLNSAVIPDKSFTITPRSNHITFKPASFELSYDKALLNTTGWATTTSGSYYHVPDLGVVTCNFSVQAQAPGVHEVWFELSGDDAPYYAIPSNVYVKSTQELRLGVENSANYAVPSMLLIVASVLLMLL